MTQSPGDRKDEHNSSFSPKALEGLGPKIRRETWISKTNCFSLLVTVQSIQWTKIGET